jgi:serine/threonine protein kinase
LNLEGCYFCWTEIHLNEYRVVNFSREGFTLDGTVKLIDFGLARIVENATVSNDVYEMSGETGNSHVVLSVAR